MKKKKGLKWALGEMLSGRGTLSAKRICGTWLILLVSMCTLWHICVYGITDVAETLLETELIVATALLGITSVTGMFSRGKISTRENIETTETETTIINESGCDSMACPHGYNCPYITNNQEE